MPRKQRQIAPLDMEGVLPTPGTKLALATPILDRLYNDCREAQQAWPNLERTEILQIIEDETGEKCSDSVIKRWRQLRGVESRQGRIHGNPDIANYAKPAKEPGKPLEKTFSLTLNAETDEAIREIPDRNDRCRAAIGMVIACSHVDIGEFEELMKSIPEQVAKPKRSRRKSTQSSK